MSSVSSIRSNMNFNLELIKQVNNNSVLKNQDFKNVDITIINNANQEYIAHISPNSQYDQENIIDSNKNSDFTAIECDNGIFNCPNASVSEEHVDNSINDSEFHSTPQYYRLDDGVADFLPEIFNNSDINWNILNSVNFSTKTELFSQKLQQSFKELTKTGRLEQKFLDNIHNKTVFLNGNRIPSNQAPDIMNIFQTSVTDYEEQQLISTYVHPEVLEAAWNNLVSRYPEVEYRASDNVRFAYEIDKIGPDMYKVAVTKTADLQSSYSENIDEINQYGVRAAMIISKNSDPEIRYSFFVR